MGWLAGAAGTSSPTRILPPPHHNTILGIRIHAVDVFQPTQGYVTNAPLYFASPRSAREHIEGGHGVRVHGLVMLGLWVPNTTTTRLNTTSRRSPYLQMRRSCPFGISFDMNS